MFSQGWEQAQSQSPAGRVSKQDSRGPWPLGGESVPPSGDTHAATGMGLGQGRDTEAEGLCDLGQATRPPYAASTQVYLRGEG